MSEQLKPFPVCVKCKHHETGYVTANGRAHSISLCGHPAFIDPIAGGQLPCKDIRAMKDFCGLEGRGFEEAPSSEDSLPEIKPNLVVVKD